MTQKQNLTRIAAGGTAWLMGSGATSMLLSLSAQIALGWFLSKDDFGLYALAMAIAACLQVFRDGGVSLWLARKQPEEFNQTANQAFWLCLFCSIIVASGLSLAAPIAASMYHEPAVARIILVLAVSTPLEAYGVVAEAGLQVHLRFRALSILRVVGPAIRYGLIVVLAAYGWGPVSFVLPLIPVAIVRAIVGYATTRLTPWIEAPSPIRIRSVFQQSRWVLSGTFASALLRKIDYLVLGLLAPTATVGVYFFAYQLSAQPVMLLSQSLRRVLIPTFARVHDDRDRQRRGALRAAAFIGVVASTLFVYFALVASAIEFVLWRGRWAAAVGAIQLLAAVMPLHLFALFSRMVIQSLGRFRLWGAALAVRSIGLAMVVYVVASSTGAQNATTIAAAVALYVAVSSLAEVHLLLKRAGIAPGPVLATMLPPYAYCVTAAAVCHFVVTQSFRLAIPTHALVVTFCYVLAITVGLATWFRPRVEDIVAIWCTYRHKGHDVRQG